MSVSDAQKQAGNYRKGHTRFGGMDVSIENYKGSTRRGVGDDGKPWSVVMPAHYGYIRRTEGADGDHVDTYLGPDRKSQRVFVVNQQHPETKKFDEHKVMMGFSTPEDAEDTYKRGFSDGRGHLRNGGMVEMSLPEFRRWVHSSRKRGPLRRADGGQVTPPPQPQTASADLDMVRRNVQRMRQDGASDDEVNTYLNMTGHQPGDIDTLTDKLGRVAQGVKGAIVGPRDEKFDWAEAFSGQGLKPGTLPASSDFTAGLVTMDDNTYGQIIKKMLGDRLLGSTKDANGYEVIAYKGDDGERHVTYINRPGMDMSDIKRFIAGSLPYIVTGGAAGSAFRAGGARLLSRMLLQGATQGATSIGTDIVAKTMGAEGDKDLFGVPTGNVDIPRALLTAGIGSALEGLSGPVAKLWRSIFSKDAVGVDGRLTEAARSEAQKMGLDPDNMDKRLQQIFTRDVREAADTSEVGGKLRPAEFGIETTKGQRTKSPNILGAEEEARRGLLGTDAQSMMSEFDKRQSRAIEDAVYGKIGRTLAPDASGREPATLGSNIRGAVSEAKSSFDRVEDQLWRDIGPMFPSEEGFSYLPGHIQKEIAASNVHPDPKLTPGADEMAKMLDNYLSGVKTASPYKILGEEVAEADLDTMRRRLLAIQQGAEGTDKVAATAIYNGYNNWIEDIAEKAALQGDPSAASKLWVARAYTKEMKSLFEQKAKGKLTPTGRAITTILENNDTPERILGTIIGQGAPTGTPPKGSVETLNTLKRILGFTTDTKGVGSWVGPGQPAWDDIRLAYWVKLVQDKQGNILSPKRLRDNIDAAFHNQLSILRTLYTDEERSLIQRLPRALDDVIYTPANPSGTSYELKRMQQAAGKDSTIRTALRTQANRELFSKHNVAMSRIYSLLAKRLPVSPLGSKEAMGARATSKFVDQAVTPKSGSPLFSPLGGYSAVRNMEQEQP